MTLLYRNAIFLFLAVGYAVGPAAGSAQDRLTRPSAEFELNPKIYSTTGIAAGDSLRTGMPFYTRALWGERGLVRVLNLAPKTRAGELRLRHHMLKWHQRMGLVTFAALMAQYTTGTRLYKNPGKYYDKYAELHESLGMVTYGLYISTASLSLLAPPARKYDRNWTSIRIHRYLAIVHFSSMIIQPWLAVYALEHPEKYDQFMGYHKQVGTVAAVSFSLALFSTFFP